MTTLETGATARAGDHGRTAGVGRLPAGRRPVPPRADRALLSDDRIGLRRRGHGPGDLPARLAGVRRLRGPLLGAHLALPHRHERVPDQPGEQVASAAPHRARPARRTGDGRARRGDRGAVARAGARRDGRRRQRRPRPRRRQPRLDPARLRGGAAAPATPPARRARAARRAALVGQGDRDRARHDRRRGEQRAPARARPARREAAQPGHGRGRPDPGPRGDARPLRAGLLGQGRQRPRHDARAGRRVGDAAVHRVVHRSRERRRPDRPPAAQAGRRTCR